MKQSAAKIAVSDGEPWQPAPVPDTSGLTTLRKAAAHSGRRREKAKARDEAVRRGLGN